MKKIIHSVTEAIGDTPLIRLERSLFNPDGAEILAKMEFMNPAGSIKDRPCLSMIEKAEAEGQINESSTIIEPTTGNTGIGLAMICAVKGYKCILTMPEDLSLERIYLLKNYGAEVILTPAKRGVTGAIEKAEELNRKIENSFMPLQFNSTANPQAHMETTAIEILEACDKFDAFVAGVGTGGTITGCAEVFKKKLPHVRIIAVEPAGCAVLSGQKAGKHRIQGIGAGFIPEILNRDLIDEVIKIDDRDAFQMARRLGQKEGLCVGISSGANVHAANLIAQRMGKTKKVITILCDTGERYFSTEQYFQA